MVNFIEPDKYENIICNDSEIIHYKINFEVIPYKINFDNVNTIEDLKDILKSVDFTFMLNKYDENSDIKKLYNRALLIKDN